MLTADWGSYVQIISLTDLETLSTETTRNIPGLKDTQGLARWHTGGSAPSRAYLEGNENRWRKACLPAMLRSNDSCCHTKEGC